MGLEVALSFFNLGLDYPTLSRRPYRRSSAIPPFNPLMRHRGGPGFPRYITGKLAQTDGIEWRCIVGTLVEIDSLIKFHKL